MTASETSPPASTADTAVPARLSILDRFLPLWIGLAMAAGLASGRLVSAVADFSEAPQVR